MMIVQGNASPDTLQFTFPSFLLSHLLFRYHGLVLNTESYPVEFVLFAQLSRLRNLLSVMILVLPAVLQSIVAAFFVSILTKFSGMSKSIARFS